MAIFITSASRICNFRIVVSAREHDDSLLLHTALFKTLCLDGQDGGAGGGARFQGLVGVSGILERKALIDVNAHLSRSHHAEQLVSGSFKLFSSRDVVEEDWARQKQRALLRQ